MDSGPINADMKVWNVFLRHPQTMDVFLKYGCPDMRRGIFPLMARMMKVRWAAKMHKIPLDLLLQDLNTVARNAK